MIALDTNVLARHFGDDDPEQVAVVRRFLGTLSAENPGFVSLVVLAELFWVLRRGSKLPTRVIHGIVDSMLDTVELEIEDEESVSRALLHARSGADFADALIGDAADLYGCTETVTFDRRAADRLGWRLLG